MLHIRTLQAHPKDKQIMESIPQGDPDYSQVLSNNLANKTMRLAQPWRALIVLAGAITAWALIVGLYVIVGAAMRAWVAPWLE